MAANNEMVITKKVIKREMIFLAIVMVASLMQAFLMCGSCDGYERYAVVTSFNLVLYFLLWRGNAYLTTYLSGRISWVEYPTRRFFIGLATTIAYTLSGTSLVILVYDNYLGLNFGSSYRLTIMIVLVITFVISLFRHSQEFLNSWRKAEIEAERLQRESISARYENLKTKINPDFLFQSLRDLDRLVFIDEEKAVTFIKKLSEVYRYVLDTREKEVVSIRSEGRFLGDYFFLLRERYTDSFACDMGLFTSDLYVPPLAIQMIIESTLLNAQFSREMPFCVWVGEKNGQAVIAHPCRFKDDLARDRYQEVITRIKDRFSFLASAPFELKESNGEIVLTFPVIDHVAEDV
jgi:hypothetical protein